MSPVLTIILALFLALLQSTVVSHVRILGVSPDMVLLFVVSWVLLQGRQEGLLAALVGGLMVDALSGGPFGLTVLSLVVVSLAAAVGERNLFRAAWFLPYITIFLATGLFYGVFLFLAQMTGRALPWGPALWRVALPAMVINTAFMSLVYTLTHALSRRLAPPTVKWS